MRGGPKVSQWCHFCHQKWASQSSFYCLCKNIFKWEETCRKCKRRQGSRDMRAGQKLGGKNKQKDRKTTSCSCKGRSKTSHLEHEHRENWGWGTTGRGLQTEEEPPYTDPGLPYCPLPHWKAKVLGSRKSIWKGVELCLYKCLIFFSISESLIKSLLIGKKFNQLKFPWHTTVSGL